MPTLPLNATPTCPYCSNVVLHQMRHHHLSWFCRHCWTEVPNAMVVFECQSDRAKNNGDEQLRRWPKERLKG